MTIKKYCYQTFLLQERKREKSEGLTLSYTWAGELLHYGRLESSHHFLCAQAWRVRGQNSMRRSRTGLEQRRNESVGISYTSNRFDAMLNNLFVTTG